MIARGEARAHRADAIRQLRAALTIDPSYEPARLVLEALNAN
ncbi:MAG: hypothetical protein ACRD1V_04460 [Vicinamibacterales bacterium]